MNIIDRGGIFVKLGDVLSDYLQNGFPGDFEDAIAQSQLNNPWFTKENILLCLENWSKTLIGGKVSRWLEPYKNVKTDNPKKIAVIMAGNIPLVGFHDLICVLVSGHSIIAKLSAQDRFLLPAITKELIKIDASIEDSVLISEDIISGFDAVIATGSNNASNYFNYYFGKYPHIIRKNRNGLAILTGKEEERGFELLTDDIFSYFGLGCRNVTKIFIPENFDLKKLNSAFMKYKDSLIQHNKYMNNYDYQKSIMLINSIPFIDMDFLLLTENTSLSSPISVLHYEYYSSIVNVLDQIDGQKENIQCIVSLERYTDFSIPFGRSQLPELWDYADGVDTLKFLMSLQ